MADKQIDALLNDMELPKGVPANAEQLIREAIESSPYLQKRILEEIKDGNLSRIGVGHSKSGNAWGFFQDEPKAAVIDSDLFKDFKERSPSQIKDAITYVLGHEVGHSNISVQRRQANVNLDADMKSAYWTEQPDKLVDITGRIDRYVRFAGSDETRAEIEGWNALVSRIEQEKGSPVTAQEAMQRALPISSFVGQNDKSEPVLLNGVKLNGGPYLSYLSPTEFNDVSTNAKAISGVFFGPELQARYAAQAVGVAAAWSKSYNGPDPSETGINFAALGLTPKMLEDAGLNLGGKDKTLQVTDTSSGGRNWITLKQTKDEKTLTPHAEPDERAFVQQDQPGKPFFDQALVALNASTTLREGALSDAEKERVAMGLAQTALRAEPPLRRIDHVAVGTGNNPNIFAVQGDLHDPAHIRAHMPMSEALQTNADQPSMTQLNQLAAQRQQEQDRQLQMEQSLQQQNNPAIRMSGP